MHHLKLLKFHTQAASIATVSNPAKMRVLFRTSREFFACSDIISALSQSPELVMHWSPDILAFLKHNIMTTLERAHQLAIDMQLNASDLIDSKSFQAKATKVFRDKSVYSFPYLMRGSCLSITTTLLTSLKVPSNCSSMPTESFRTSSQWTSSRCLLMDGVYRRDSAPLYPAPCATLSVTPWAIYRAVLSSGL
jgi:hypothetical protein